MSVNLMPPADAQTMTYEEYMSEGEIIACYDILDGVRHFLPNPTPLRQEITMNVAMLFREYRRQSQAGWSRVAPCDILITRTPLSIRQCDVLFIGHERYGNRHLNDASPYSPAPELVVEVLSDSDTRQMRMAKIRDFCAVDVRECWLVSPEGGTVEVLRLTMEGPVREELYGAGQSVQSLTFPDLTPALDDIFRIDE